MMNLEQLREFVRQRTDPRGNSFYRDLFGLDAPAPALEIASWDDWLALPFLTKDALVERPLRERSFIPWSEIETISTTSGTSGGPPLFQPRTYQGSFMDRIGAEHPRTRGAWLTGMIQYPHEHERSLEALGVKRPVLQLDPRRVPQSVALAAAAGVDMIMAQTFFVTATCDSAVASGLAERVQLILAAGETWPASDFERVRKAYRNADIYCIYGTREAGSQGITQRLNDNYRVAYRSWDHVFHELIDPATGAHVSPAPGLEAEILITTPLGENSGFPLIRYRIGDTVRVVEVGPGERDFTFELVGRQKLEFVKFPGGLLRVDELDRVIRSTEGLLSDEYEAHCFERGDKKSIVLHIALAPQADSQAVARAIASELHIGPTFTYADGVEKGAYEPLVCAALSEKRVPGKRVKIVKHW